MHYNMIFNIIMLIITFISICFTIYYIYNFCTNLDVFEYNNTDYNKTLLLIAGVHGNEPAGALFLLALREQLKNNTMNILNTRIILMPYVNKCGLFTHLRNLLFFTDINRNFKNDTTSPINKKMLEYIKNIKEADLIVDIHE